MDTKKPNSLKIKYLSEPRVPPFSNFLELPPIFKVVTVQEGSLPIPSPETSEKQEAPPSSGKQ